MTSMGRSECRFCSRYSGAMQPTEAWDHRLVESDHFVVVPTKGALVAGWLLVIPREHVLSSHSVSRAHASELEQVLERACELVRTEFGTPTVFEHGATTAGSAFGCGIDHAHLHVAPLGFSLLDAAQRFAPTLEWSQRGAPWRSDRSDVPYLAASEFGQPWVTAFPAAVPRQFFRRVIAAALGNPERFDYDAVPNQDVVEHTVASLTRGAGVKLAV